MVSYPKLWTIAYDFLGKNHIFLISYQNRPTHKSWFVKNSRIDRNQKSQLVYFLRFSEAGKRENLLKNKLVEVFYIRQLGHFLKIMLYEWCDFVTRNVKKNI